MKARNKINFYLSKPTATIEPNTPDLRMPFFCAICVRCFFSLSFFLPRSFNFIISNRLFTATLFCIAYGLGVIHTKARGKEKKIFIDFLKFYGNQLIYDCRHKIQYFQAKICARHWNWQCVRSFCVVTFVYSIGLKFMTKPIKKRTRIRFRLYCKCRPLANEYIFYVNSFPVITHIFIIFERSRSKKRFSENTIENVRWSIVGMTKVINYYSSFHFEQSHHWFMKSGIISPLYTERCHRYRQNWRIIQTQKAWK